MKVFKQALKDILELFFPSLCITCGQRLISQEQFLCLQCWSDLPMTNFHKSRENKVAQLFWGRVEVQDATALFLYKKGSRYQKLLHHMKYKGQKELGQITGKRLGWVIKESPYFEGIDVIVPVPLHPKKLKKRGYNQSEWIAKGIAEALGKPLSTGNLYRKVHTDTQTRKNRYERWMNVEGIFKLEEPEEYTNKHILLVDDVLTTGSTVEASAFPIVKLRGTKVSVATLAFADI